MISPKYIRMNRLWERDTLLFLTVCRSVHPNGSSMVAALFQMV